MFRDFVFPLVVSVETLPLLVESWRRSKAFSTKACPKQCLELDFAAAVCEKCDLRFAASEAVVWKLLLFGLVSVNMCIVFLNGK